MDVKQAYDVWADQYDSNINRTRDIEAISLQTVLADIPFDSCMEIGCGTGKNTEWLAKKAREVLAVDFSDEMLKKARQKIQSGQVQFIQADITKDWSFVQKQYDLVTFSLVLEHIENLDDIFKKVYGASRPEGIVYVGELHPFKQYAGSKARFETNEGQHIVQCFRHHLSDFTSSAKRNGFEILLVEEFFDEDDRTLIPRILTLVLKKS